MEIRPIGHDELDRLEPLWLELHAHHQEVAPELAPYVDDDASWVARRALYERTLASGGFALILEEGEQLLGYVLVGEETAHWPASLVTEPRAYEIHTLLVRESARGRGAGTALLDAVEERLASETADRYIGVVPGNTRAAALYERRGFIPTVLVLTRFGRPDDAPAVAVDPEVELVSPTELDALEPLWLELHHHHQRTASRLAPYVDDDRSWAEKRRQLVKVTETGRVLRLGPAEAPLGMASFAATDEIALWADTWVTGRETAELKAIVVAERARGQGIGRRLLDSVDALLAADGVHDQSRRRLRRQHRRDRALPAPWLSTGLADDGRLPSAARRVAVMEVEQVPVGIGEQRLVADAAVDRLAEERHAA